MDIEEIISPQTAKYASRYTTADNGLLRKVYEDTKKNHPYAHLMSDSVQGRFLTFISRILRPKYILEVGTFTGYSALCLAQGLEKGGSLHTIELRANDAEAARRNFSISAFHKQITLHEGLASEIIPTLNFEWDLVFIDADKTGYIDYYNMVVPRITEKGLIIVDNVLFHGKVLEEQTLKGKSAKAIAEFNNYVNKDPRTEQVLLTIRDGLMFIKKKQRDEEKTDLIY